VDASTRDLKPLATWGGNVRLVRGLLEAGVRFLVVGGSAVHFHYPWREPGDLDLLVEPTAENARRVAAALAALGSPPLDPGVIERLACADLPYAHIDLKDHPEFNADILSDRISNFEEVWAGAAEATVGDCRVWVASIRALLARLSRSSLPKHVDDKARLHRVLRQRHPR